MDIDRYRAFIDTKGHLTLMCNRWAWVALFGVHFERPFEEKILIWHIATDLCFYLRGTSSEHICAPQCREVSNYMMHMLVRDANRAGFAANPLGKPAPRTRDTPRISPQ